MFLLKGLLWILNLNNFLLFCFGLMIWLLVINIILVLLNMRIILIDFVLLFFKMIIRIKYKLRFFLDFNILSILKLFILDGRLLLSDDCWNFDKFLRDRIKRLNYLVKDLCLLEFNLYTFGSIGILFMLMTNLFSSISNFLADSFFAGVYWRFWAD